ncbi:MAG: hypothetical protein LBU22_12165 [Dysgonamonadaceae bacterium]|jgi:hypothetical protein|nr:hypothetical protein [Dysgonamonadaceae bacterium]
MKSIFTILLILVVFTAKAQFAGGAGTAADPYQISNRAQLEALGGFLGADNIDKHFLLTADIDLGGDKWTPLAIIKSNPFCGKLHGAGHKIKNLLIEEEFPTSSMLDYVGLFGVLGGGVSVDDLHFEGVITISAGASIYAGSLAGYINPDNAESINIVKCSSSVLITCSTSGSAASNFVGGIIGFAELHGNNLTISKCANTGNISGTGSMVGGIVGRVFTSTNGAVLISDCYNNAEISSTKASGDTWMGGIVGTPYQGDATSAPITIEKCFATGKVEANAANTSSRVGGIVGRIYDISGSVNPITISNSVGAQESVSSGGTSTTAANRIYASHSSGGNYSITNNYGYVGMVVLRSGASATITSSATGAGGLNKTLAELKSRSTYTGLGWDFTNIWQIEEGLSFPTLKGVGGSTGIKTAPVVNTLKASASNGILRITGLVAGETLRVYTLQGVNIWSRTVKSLEQNIPVQGHGIYIVVAGEKHVKVVF